MAVIQSPYTERFTNPKKVEPHLDSNEDLLTHAEESDTYVWDPNGLTWVRMTQPGGGGGGAVTIADGADVAQGATTDAAVISDANGTLSGKLRGLVKWAFERMPASLGQKAMAASLPVVLASDQASVPVAATLSAETVKVIGAVNQGTNPWVTTTSWAAAQHVIVDSGAVTVSWAAAQHIIVDSATIGALTDRTQKTQITDGTRDGTVKAASTLPVLTDTAIVTTQRDPLPAGTNVIGHFIVDSGTITTVTTVTTVTAVTAITNALPAGTNRLGSVRIVDSADADLTAAKAVQTARSVGVTEQKDAGRVNIMWTAEFSPAAIAEALLTITESRDGAAVTTFTSKAVTNGKRIRITSWAMTVENTLGVNPKRAKLRLRFNTAGAVVVASPLQANLVASVATAVNTVGQQAFADFPDGIEYLGDGTKQIGFTLEFPDWVTAAQTGKVYITVFAFEY